MKNKITLFLALGLVLFIAVGCGFGNLLKSKEETPKDSSTSAPEKTKETSDSSSTGEVVKVGIAECDELATYINDNAEAIGEESIVVRGIVEMYKQTIFSNLRDSVEKMNDEEKAKMGENCAKALENLKKQIKK